MNNFEPKEIKIASIYLKEKLKLFKSSEENVYKMEDKKSSSIKKVFNMIFKS